jgi:hypothetical protein
MWHHRLFVRPVRCAAIRIYAKDAQLPLADFSEAGRWFELVQALPGWQRSQPPPS